MLNNSAELDQAILILKGRDEQLRSEVAQQYQAALQSLKPGTLIKSAISNAVPANGLGSLLKTAGSIGLSLLGGKLSGGRALLSGGNIAGSVANMVASNAVRKSSGKFAAYGKALAKNLFRKKA